MKLFIVSFLLNGAAAQLEVSRDRQQTVVGTEGGSDADIKEREKGRHIRRQTRQTVVGTKGGMGIATALMDGNDDAWKKFQSAQEESQKKSAKNLQWNKNTSGAWVNSRPKDGSAPSGESDTDAEIKANQKNLMEEPTSTIPVKKGESAAYAAIKASHKNVVAELMAQLPQRKE